MTSLRKTWLPLAIEAHRQLKAAMPRHWWLIGGLPRLCQWEKREKMGKTSKNFSGCCVYLCFLVHFHPFSQFVFLRRSNLPVKQKQRDLGAMSGLPRPCHVTVLRPLKRRKFCKFCGPQEFSAYPDVGQAAVTYTDPWAAYEDSTCDLPWLTNVFGGSRLTSDFGQSLNQESWLANVSR